jgi:RHS repeat-associated protein
VIAVYDNSATEKTAIDYTTAFGETTVSGAETDFPYGFTGRRRLAAAGLYDYRARAYEPKLGRFLQRDPIGAWGDPSSRGNPYLYASASPTVNVDPAGREAEDAEPNDVPQPGPDLGSFFCLCDDQCSAEDAANGPFITGIDHALRPNGALGSEGAESDLKFGLSALDYIGLLGAAGGSLGELAKRIASGAAVARSALSTALNAAAKNGARGRAPGGEPIGPTDELKKLFEGESQSLGGLKGVEIWVRVKWKCCQTEECLFWTRTDWESSSRWHRCSAAGHGRSGRDLTGLLGGFAGDDKEGIEKALLDCYKEAMDTVARCPVKR